MSTAAIIIVDPPEDFDPTAFSPHIDYVLVLDKTKNEDAEWQCPNPEHDWLAVIRNSGGKSSAAFRVNVLDVITNASNIDPVAVHDKWRYEGIWDLPIITPAERD